MNRQPARATDERLRWLLRAGRRAAGSLSQKEAASKAGISEVYWQKIESGTQETAPVDTLAAMCAAAGLTPERLHDEGYPDIADACADLDVMAPADPSAEDHLAATPGASDEEISALQAVWRALKAERTPEPFERELRRTRKRRREPDM